MKSEFKQYEPMVEQVKWKNETKTLVELSPKHLIILDGKVEKNKAIKIAEERVI